MTADRPRFRDYCSSATNDCLSNSFSTIRFAGDFMDHSIGKPFQQQTISFRLFNMSGNQQVIELPTVNANISGWLVIDNPCSFLNFGVSPQVVSLNHSLIMPKRNFQLSGNQQVIELPTVNANISGWLVIDNPCSFLNFGVSPQVVNLNHSLIMPKRNFQLSDKTFYFDKTLTQTFGSNPRC